MKSDQLIYYIALQQVPTIGPKLAKNLIAYCGSAEAIFKEKTRSLEKIPGIGFKTAKLILSFKEFDRAKKEIDFIEKHQIKASVFFESTYPERLKDVEIAPVVLYLKGNVDLNYPRIIGIVGTRRATSYGKDLCTLLVHQLKDYNAMIVSGLAYGIDHIAHKTAVELNMPTVAVLGHGLDMIYPSQHRGLAVKMLENGGLLTEYNTETQPIGSNFPDRNRIVAGMVDGIVVVESAKKGGALITAQIAYTYNREIFAVPGKVGDEYSEGCNNYIRLQKANMITNAHDIAYHLGWDIQNNDLPAFDSKKFESLKGADREIINLLKEKEKIHIDSLATKIKLNSSELSIKLLELEFKDLIQTLPGHFYRLKNKIYA